MGWSKKKRKSWANPQKPEASLNRSLLSFGFLCFPLKGQPHSGGSEKERRPFLPAVPGRLQVRRAWRIENPLLFAKYRAEQDAVRASVDSLKRRLGRAFFGRICRCWIRSWVLPRCTLVGHTLAWTVWCGLAGAPPQIPLEGSRCAVGVGNGFLGGPWVHSQDLKAVPKAVP